MLDLYRTWIHPGGFFADLVLKYQWMDNDMDVFESDGARVNGYTSLLGRLGVLVGYENDARTRNFYAKVSKVKDFEGDIVVRMNGNSFAYRFGSSWWVYGVGFVGFTAKLNDRNSLYLDLERTSGAYFTQDWAIKAGWRKTF